MSDAALSSLRAALLADDRRLIQGRTTSPPPLACVQDWPPEGCCPVGWCGWLGGEGLATVGEVEEFFASCCAAADASLGEPAGCRRLLNFWDETPRDEARTMLAEEVENELHRRAS